MTRLGLIITGILVAVVVLQQHKISSLSQPIINSIDTTAVFNHITVIQNYPERIDTIVIKEKISDTIYLKTYPEIHLNRID